MPIYEYACQDCGKEFEALVRSSTVPECPSCHSTQLAKKLSVPAPAVTDAAAAPMPAGCGGCPAMGNAAACAMHHAH